MEQLQVGVIVPSYFWVYNYFLFQASVNIIHYICFLLFSNCIFYSTGFVLLLKNFLDLTHVFKGT